MAVLLVKLLLVYNGNIAFFLCSLTYFIKLRAID